MSIATDLPSAANLKLADELHDDELHLTAADEILDDDGRRDGQNGRRSEWLRGIRAFDFERQGVEHTVAHLIEWALNFGATDVYFSSQLDRVAVSARYMGSVTPVTQLSVDYATRCIVHIRHMGGLKVDGRRLPQDGRWTLRRQGGSRFADLRLNTIPTLCGETMSIRVLSQDPGLEKLEGLGFVGPQLQQAEALLTSLGGQILVVGPTGSGKTTAMYAILRRLNDGTRKIHTIEDPIEYAVPGLHQSQVNEIHGPRFEELLSAILRQSPDVIMVGEIRNAATAEISVRAANAGNLVLATVHAPVAVQAIQSMLSLHVTPRFLATSLKAVIACRLIRKLDPASRIPVDLTTAPQTFEEVRRWLKTGDGDTVYAPSEADGDPTVGYRGLTGVFEILTMTPALRKMVEEMQPPQQIAKQAAKEGMLDFRRAGLLKVAKGETSFEEMVRVIPSEDVLEDGLFE